MRSAIRVIQDVLVDTSKVLAPGTPVLADAPTGRLATADQFFDTLRTDILKVMPHVVSGVDRVSQALPGDVLALRIAKAIGALQPIEGFPRTVENLAALLYARVGDPPIVDAVREALRRIVDANEIGLVDDPQAGGYTFLSEGVKPLRKKRDEYQVSMPEVRLLRSQTLRGLLDPLPSVSLEGAKTVKAGVRLGNAPIAGEDEEVQFRLEIADRSSWDERRTTLLTETTGNIEWQSAIAWLICPDESVDDLLVEVVKSRNIIKLVPESEVDRDIAQFVRAERRAAEKNEEDVQSLYRKALLEGTLIFRGKPTPASVAGATVDAAACKVLQEAAAQIFNKFHLVNIRPATDLAAKFLSVERLDRMTQDVDPLGLVAVVAGRRRVDPNHPALAETLRAFRQKLDDQGTSRLQGNAIQDLFASPPYGWSKDATRYLFAALLVAGEIVLFTEHGEIRTSGPTAIEALHTTRSFGRVGVSLRDTRPSIETLDRAATRLEGLLGIQVHPLEDHISRAAREYLPGRLDAIASLPVQLRLLGISGTDRAQGVCDTGRGLLQQDGANAVAILGAVDCTFPDDLRWAEAATQALENGAGDEVRSVQDTISKADNLSQLFPSFVDSLVTATERDAVSDALSSDAFFRRLPDLRGVERSIRDRAAKAYETVLLAYRDELASMRSRIEARPEWVQITDEDRNDLMNRLNVDLPDKPADGEELSQLSILLARKVRLPGLESELFTDLKRRVPSGQEASVGEIVINVADLPPQRALADTVDLAAWLDELRAQLEKILSGNVRVRLEVRS